MSWPPVFWRVTSGAFCPLGSQWGHVDTGMTFLCKENPFKFCQVTLFLKTQQTIFGCSVTIWHLHLPGFLHKMFINQIKLALFDFSILICNSKMKHYALSSRGHEVDQMSWGCLDYGRIEGMFREESLSHPTFAWGFTSDCCTEGNLQLILGWFLRLCSFSCFVKSHNNIVRKIT